MSGVLVIGGSQAGHQVAATLREVGYDAPIALVGDESGLPYQRPPLSKAFLAGSMTADQLALRTADFYAARDIEYVAGERVVEVHCPSPHTGSGTATTASGRLFAFDQLALTVGADVRRLDVPGSNLGGLKYLRNIDDARSLGDSLAKARSVVVVGGGFIGLEAAAVARAKGLDVTVVEAGPRLIQRAVAPIVSDFYLAAHTRRGVRILLDSVVSSFEGRDGFVTSVRLQDGRELAADLVIIGIGVVPRTELAEQLGLVCANGITVDGGARTSHPGVVAAGDCTSSPHPRVQARAIRLESVQNAVDQGKAAATTLAGLPQKAQTVPWFWSDQGDLKLQIAGLSHDHDATVVRGSVSDENFSILYYRENRLIAVDAINRPQDYLAVRRALGDGLTVPIERASSTEPLKSLVVTAS